MNTQNTSNFWNVGITPDLLIRKPNDMEGFIISLVDALMEDFTVEEQKEILLSAKSRLVAKYDSERQLFIKEVKDFSNKIDVLQG